MSSVAGTTQQRRYQGNSNSLYPDLAEASLTPRERSTGMEDGEDVLAALGVPPAKSKARPARPPPPSRNNTAPVIGSVDVSISKKTANVSSGSIQCSAVHVLPLVPAIERLVCGEKSSLLGYWW